MGGVLSWINMAEDPQTEISVTSEADGLGIRSVLTPEIADVWRSGPVPVGNYIPIRLDFGRVVDGLRLIAIAAPRDGVLPGSAARVRVTASTVAVNGTDALDTAARVLTLAPKGIWAWLTPAAFSARWVRIDLQAGAGDSHFQLGRVWAGPALVTQTSVAYGQRRGYADGGENARSGISGVRYATRGAVRRTANFQFPSLRQADAEALDDLALSAGTTGQVFVSPFQETLIRDGFFGHFTAPPEPRASTFQRWSADIAAEEDL